MKREEVPPFVLTSQLQHKMSHDNLVFRKLLNTFHTPNPRFHGGSDIRCGTAATRVAKSPPISNTIRHSSVKRFGFGIGWEMTLSR